MNNKWTIGKKIGTGFASVVLILAIMGIINLFSMRSIENTNRVLDVGTETLSALNRCAVERRDFMINGMTEGADGQTAADRWGDAYDELSVGLRALQDEKRLPGDMRANIAETVRGLDEYADAFRSGVNAWQSREDAFGEWSEVGWSFTEQIQKATDEVINPAWQKAVDENNLDEIQHWAQINISLGQNVVQPFLLLRVTAVYLLATRADAQWNAFQSQLKTTREGIATWRDLIRGNTELEKLAGELNEQMDRYSNAGNQFYQAVAADREAGTRMAASAASIVHTVDMVQDRLANDMSAVITRANFSSWTITLLGIVTGVVLAVLITVGIVKAIKRIIDGLASGSEQTASASEQVSAASQSLAQGASEQASSLEESSASLEEMASMSRQNADNASQADTLMEQAKKAVSESMHAMKRMTGEINNIRESANQTAKIIKTIDEIAFQTNLLALNAAVEAARAGEAGKGFAVVAEEVRNLAQRSAEAARNTADLIEGSQKNAESGVNVTEELAKSMQEVAESAEKVAALIAEISAASKEQAQGVDQVNTAVAEMDKVVQQNAANAEESASASEELSSQAQELNAMVAELSAMVGGSNGNGRFNHQSVRKLKTFATRKPQGTPSLDKQGRPGTATHNALEKDSAGARAKAVKPQEVIPLDDSDFKDF